MTYLLTNQESERLKFRALRKEDFDAWVPLFFNKQAAINLGMDPSNGPEENCKKWFEKSFYRYKNNLGGVNVLINKTTGNFIGQSGLLIQTVEGKEKLEIGYSILPKYWGMGYATEAAQKCKDYAFSNNLTDHLISMVFVENEASAKVALKNGMQLEKTIVDFDGMPLHIFGIHKTTWLRSK